MDRITFEIVRSSLYGIAREMKIAMMRTAASPIIHSGGDASAAIFDADMRLVAQGNDIPTMLGSAVLSTRASVDAIGKERLRPGDVILSNDVYLAGGNHHPDVQMTRPVFVNGVIVAFTMTRGHWSDIGGQSPGSFDPDTWDIFGEGIRIPPVRLFRDDRLVEDVVKLIVQNTRDPEGRLLDIKSQYAGVKVGDQRMSELVRRYGGAEVAAAMAESLDLSERLTRAKIAGMPDGVYRAEDSIEAVGAAPSVSIQVAITICGDSMTVDFTGSSPQARGGINCPYSVTCNSVWYTLKAITDATIPVNEGCYRPVRIVAPEGSILNCVAPASVVSGTTESSPRVIDMLLRALAPAIPDRVIAQSYCAAGALNLSGADTDLRRVARTGKAVASIIDVHAGGMGARPNADGVSAVRVHVGNTSTQPVELIESLVPITVQEWALVPDSGGAGQYRGGLSTRRVYRIDYDEATCSLVAERGHDAPQGVLGGKAGATFRCEIRRGNGELLRLPAKSPQSILMKGDELLVEAAGSGGYGEPAHRARTAIEADLADGYITIDAAARDYGPMYSADRVVA